MTAHYAIELRVNGDGTLTLPPSVLAESGLGPNALVLAWAEAQGKVLIRRFEDAAERLMKEGSLS